jgi:hypothetical protein
LGLGFLCPASARIARQDAGRQRVAPVGHRSQANAGDFADVSAGAFQQDLND